MKEASTADKSRTRTLAEKKVIVVGAGIGGLAAALMLAPRARVTVLESRSEPGGKMRDAIVDGQRIDIGPTVLTMKWVFEELFAAAGADFDSAVPTSRLNVLARHGWRDGSRFDLLAEDRAAIDAVGDFSGAEEAGRFALFLRDAKSVYDTLRDSFLRAPGPDMLGMMRGAGPFGLLRIDPFTSYWTALGRTFKDPRLRQLFARYATYCGSSPYRAPATLMLIAHVEKAGVWAPLDGMAGLARASARLAGERGVSFRFDETAAQVLVDQGRTAGVLTSGGERLLANAVIFNGDVAALGAGLLGHHVAPFASGSGRARSQSAMTFALSAKASGFPLDRHTVFFSDAYKAEFDSVFERREMPRQPTTYVWAPVPGGPLFCLVNAPAAGGSPHNAQEAIAGCRTRMLDHLEACGLKLEISSETAMTPGDFARDYPGTDGALYGAPSHGWRATFERPGVRTRLAGLYLAGGSVHPGPGVPMAALSGMAAARCLMNDFGLT